MSYATGTTHYNLPQTVGSDKRDWTDTNQAFSDLDTAVYGAAQGAEAATSAIQSINSELDVIAGKQATDEENITTLNGKVSTLESTTSTLGAEVLDVRQDLQDNIESKHEASATSTHAYAIGDTFYYNDILYKATAAIAIGDTIVPTVNCMGITVMSQVSAIKGDLTASDGLGFEFMTDGDGNYGYRGADDSFVPFSSGGGRTLIEKLIVRTSGDFTLFDCDGSTTLKFTPKSATSLYFEVFDTVDGSGTAIVNRQIQAGDVDTEIEIDLTALTNPKVFGFASYSPNTIENMSW